MTAAPTPPGDALGLTGIERRNARYLDLTPEQFTSYREWMRTPIAAWPPVVLQRARDLGLCTEVLSHAIADHVARRISTTPPVPDSVGHAECIDAIDALLAQVRVLTREREADRLQKEREGE